MPAAVSPSEYPYTNAQKFDAMGGFPDLRRRVALDIAAINTAETSSLPIPNTVICDPRREWASACDFADAHLARVFTLPLTAFPNLLTELVNRIAGWHLAVIYGLAQDGTDSPEHTRYKDALKTLEGIRDGKLKPSGFQDATAGAPVANLTDSIVPEITSLQPRGWDRRS